MTKSELLSDLANKSDVLDTNTPVLVGTTENIKKYDVPVVLDKGNNIALGASQPILVIDEGETSEVAYYNNRKIFNVNTTAFKDSLESQADSFEGQTHSGSVIVKVVVDEVFEEREAGLVTAYKDDGSSISAMLYKKDDGSWASPQVVNG